MTKSLSIITANIGLRVGAAYGGIGQGNSPLSTLKRLNDRVIMGVLPYAGSSEDFNKLCKAVFVPENPAKDIYENMIVAQISGDFNDNHIAVMVSGFKRLATSLRQEAIALHIAQNNGVNGGLLVGEYSHKADWGFGVFNPSYFVDYETALNEKDGKVLTL